MSCASPRIAASTEHLAQARKAVSRELHAMSGNASTSAALSRTRNVRLRAEVANDDDMDVLLGNTSSSASAPILPAQRPDSAGRKHRMRITRKRTLGMSLALEGTTETCEERYCGCCAPLSFCGARDCVEHLSLAH